MSDRPRHTPDPAALAPREDGDPGLDDGAGGGATEDGGRPPGEDLLDRALIDELLAGLPQDSLLGVVEMLEADASKAMAEISAALRAGDARAVVDPAHSLKGAAANLGGARVATLCRSMEERGRAGDLEGALALADELAGAAAETPTALREELSRRASADPGSPARG